MKMLSMSLAGVTPHEYAALLGKDRRIDRQKLAEKLRFAGQLDEEYLKRNMRENNISVITIEDGTYPAGLREIYDPPYIIYCRGDVGLLNDPLLGVVGSRKATSYSRTALSDILPHFKNKISDRKSTRLNSSHVAISYAVFCLKKKRHEQQTQNVGTNG